MPEQPDSNAAGVTVGREKSQPEHRSILDIIESGRWSRALFTSFTLSLTHFESYVWPRLRRAGCEQVDILVDRLGIADSLMERHARGVGRQYVPTPVAMSTGGTFHPKLVYLWSKEGPLRDLLLVGSGNLTYPGHGGNLEVLEVLGPSRHATAFSQAADFFESLATSPKVDVADGQALGECAARSSSAAASGETLELARFVHCLDVPGIEQFEAAAKQLVTAGTEWESCLSLSPFHHPKATPELRLLQEFGIRVLKVGVSSRAGETSSFPFSEAAAWPNVQVECLAPVAEKGESRALHAKWLELRASSQALVLSGSFNATEESLCSTKNVECGVLRELSAPSDCWAVVPQPAYKRSTFERSGSAAIAIVWARLVDPYTIHGRLLGASGQWQGPAEVLAEAGNVPVAQGTVQLNPDLSFVWKIDAPLTETQSSSVQLTIESFHGTARGWVSVERILRLDPDKRELLALVTQLETGNETIEDMQALVGYLTSDAAHLMATQPREQAPVMSANSAGSLRGGGSGEHPNASPGMSPEQFGRAAKRAVDNALAWSPSQRLLETFGQKGPSWEVIEQVLDALRGRTADGTEPHPRNGEGPPGKRRKKLPEKPEETTKQTEQVERAGRQLLAKLEFDIESRIASLNSDRRHDGASLSASASALAIARHMWILVHNGMRLCAWHLRDDELTEAFARRFLRSAAERHRGWPDINLLDEAVAGLAALMALNSMTPGRPVGELSDLNACLEAYFGVGHDRRYLEELAVQWLDCDLGLTLLGSRPVVDACTALGRALEEPTPRTVVSRALTEGDGVLDKEPYVSWHPRRLELLRGALSDTGAIKNPMLRVFDPRVGYFHAGCFADVRTGRDSTNRRVLGGDFAADMARWRLAACPSCKRVLVWLTP